MVNFRCASLFQDVVQNASKFTVGNSQTRMCLPYLVYLNRNDRKVLSGFDIIDAGLLKHLLTFICQIFG